MADTLTALSQRREAFWIGLAVFLLGVATPTSLELGGVGLSRLLIVAGGGLLVLRLLVGCYRILRTTARAGAAGYRDGSN